LLELPTEQEIYQLKLNKSQDVRDAAKYLQTVFWEYANNPKYKLTQDDYEATVSYS